MNPGRNFRKPVNTLNKLLIIRNHSILPDQLLLPWLEQFRLLSQTFISFSRYRFPRRIECSKKLCIASFLSTKSRYKVHVFTLFNDEFTQYVVAEERMKKKLFFSQIRRITAAIAKLQLSNRIV